MIVCAHGHAKKDGCDRLGKQRYRCLLCGKTFCLNETSPLGEMRVSVDDAKLALHYWLRAIRFAAPNG